ncbi:NAD(+) synthase [Epulopiscium sp. SCG-B10WGA-EpuloA2]|nr:NAD(+) synthase [Epulopiscium sp. SCG-B10WGA-EpuloA2]
MNFNLEQRLDFIKQHVKNAGAKGVVVGISGGKDSAVTTALCVKALGCENVLGISMPCSSNPKDEEHAKMVADAFGVEFFVVDLKDSFEQAKKSIATQVNFNLSDLALANVKPRLRMITLYTIAQSKNYLVVGTDNLSEMVMGYFTKWGDGAYDINPLSDLTVSEVLAFGAELGVPELILTKAPSAGLWEGQTDEIEMGVTYKEIDEFIKTGQTNIKAQNIIETANKKTQHKREMPYFFRAKK